MSKVKRVSADQIPVIDISSLVLGEAGVWSGNLFNAMLTRNMHKSSWQYFIVRGCSIASIGR